MKKAFIGYEALVKLIVGVLFAILAVSIAKSCAESFFTSSDQGAESFKQFTEKIEKTALSGGTISDTTLLIMDDNALILGFAKSADSIEIQVPSGLAFPESKYPNGIWKIARPLRTCGEKGSNACACLCKDPPKLNTELGSHVCESLQCTRFSNNVDFQQTTFINEILPEPYITIDMSTLKSPFVIKNGFLIERFSRDGPIIIPYERWLSLQDKPIPSQQMIPRRFPIFIEKKSNGKIAVCLRLPCVEK